MCHGSVGFRRLFLAVVVACVALKTAGAATQHVRVGAGGLKFVDATSGNSTTTINVGDTVEWDWSSSAHPLRTSAFQFLTRTAEQLPAPSFPARQLPFTVTVNNTGSVYSAAVWEVEFSSPVVLVASSNPNCSQVIATAIRCNVGDIPATNGNKYSFNVAPLFGRSVVAQSLVTSPTRGLHESSRKPGLSDGAGASKAAGKKGANA